ncbi:MAG: 5-bromo-4-chloroindolyl phosphate hydrolysis family protein [Roseovarius sp.]
MAQRFGGKFSPTPTGSSGQPSKDAFRGARRTRAGGRVNLLFLAPLPLILRAFTSEPLGLALNLLALALLLLAAWMTREGILAQEAYDARKIARRPGFPRKIAGSILTGLGLGLAGFAAGGGTLAPVIFIVLGAALHSFAFGIDPMRDKGMDGIDRFQTDRVARVVEKAQEHMAAMNDALRRAGDRRAEDAMSRFQASVQTMLSSVEDDPRDLTAARKYLGVYLMGARDATVKFADIYARSQDEAAHTRYLSLLTDLDKNFAAKTAKLMEDDTTDLDIEIEVLQSRLGQDGIHLTRDTS